MALLKANTGIGITNPSAALHVVGDGIFVGVVNATTFYGNLVGTATSATNLVGGVQGSVPYQSAVNSTTFLAPGSDGNVLVTKGVGQNPIWVSPSALSGAFNGVTIKDEGSIVGFADSIRSINFVGPNVVATASGAGATITLSNDAQYLTGTAPGSVISQSSGFNVTGNVTISGNLSVGGTSVILNAATVNIKDKDIIVGITTNALGQDVSTDFTANHGGIAIASTEGSPLFGIDASFGIDNIPSTYKQIMWLKSGALTGLNTDAWLFNYAVGVGTNQVPNGVRLAVGNVQFTQNDLVSVRNINASGVITATQFVGSLLGNVTSADYAKVAGIATYATSSGIATYAPNAGIATYATNAGIATYAPNAGIATYAPNAGIATYATSSGIATYAPNAGIATYAPNAGIATYATSSGIATYATSSGIATYAPNAGISTNVIGGIASVTSLSVSVSGISTLGTVKISSGIVTSTNPGVSTVFYYGDGSGLTNINIGSISGAIAGITIRDEGSIVGTSGSVTSVNFVGGNVVATASGANATITIADNLVGTALSISGISTLGTTSATNLTAQQLRITGVSTFTAGPVLIGTATSTGTASQPLQVTGGAYVSGNLGIGTTNPSQSLHIQGNARLTGALYDSTNATGSSGQILSSTGSAISWISASITNVGSANSIAITADSTNASRYLTFVSTTSGNNIVYVNSGLLYNPSTGDASVNGLTIGRGTGSVSSNTALGYQALYSNTTGTSNTANGLQALYSNTTGIKNTANGYEALLSNITGSNNTANGYYALVANTTGGNNTANGYRALRSNITGSNNTATGASALHNNTTGTQNTAIGYRALYTNTTGTSNTANGLQALYTNTTGQNNTATGHNSLQANTTGSNNTATGLQALYSNTTGTQNTAAGYQALFSNTTASNNTATGVQALYSNTTGVQNTANGYKALNSNTTASNNTANGHSVLNSNTTGTNNTANGYYALFSNTTGTNNTATGVQALVYNITGQQNTATGYQALFSNTTGTQNTATGQNALRSNTTGVQNTANGYQALKSNTTGTNNTAIGLSAGYNITTGSNNSFLGYNAQPSSATVSNEITLGDTSVDTLRVPGLGFYGVRTNTTVATTSVTTIDSIVVATYRSARIQIQITQGSNYQVSDVLLIHDGTTASIIEYGTLATGSTLGTYSATISSGNALLQVTMGSATSSAVKVLSYRTVV
jgi:hypothetical protein